MADLDSNFENRKRDHIRIALSDFSQSEQSAGFESIQLIHEALPDFNLSDVRLTTPQFGHDLGAPFFVSSMTAGHRDGEVINQRLARFSQTHKILMGVGSQRRELFDEASAREWRTIRRESPGAILAANIGIAQAIQEPSDRLKALVENLQAVALFVHLNPLQECLQQEGTPNYAGSLIAIERTVKDLGVPVIIKETGSGISVSTLERLEGTGVYAVDVSGVGGTHWGQVEEHRLPPESDKARVASAFRGWGLTTRQCLQDAAKRPWKFRIWASGGVRTGVDVAKCIAMGADMVGLARPWLQAALAGELESVYGRLSAELSTSLFCTGARTPEELRNMRRWQSWT